MTIPGVLPENCFQPLYHTSLGEDAIDLAATAGLILDDWQAEIVSTSMTFKESGKFAARTMLLLITRQQGKNVCVEARELAALFLLGEKNIGHTAHEFRTAQSSFKRLRERIEATPELEPERIRFRNSGAETSILTPDGGYMVFTPRTPGALRGLSIDLLILDEAYSLTADQMSALKPTQNAVPNPQTWVTSSTGFEDSLELLAFRARALKKAPNIGFFEYKSDDGSDPGDRAQWVKALPGLRTGRQDIAEVIDGYEHALATGDFTDFDREMRGLWATTDIPSLIPMRVWNDLLDEESAMGTRKAFAVDVAPDYSTAAVYVAGENPDGQFHVQFAADDEGVHWLPEYLKSVQEKYKPSAIALDPGGPAGVIIPELNSLGVKFTAMSASDVMQACGQFYNMATGNRLRHVEDAELATAVGAGIKRLIGKKGGWAWDRKNPDANITYLVAATYALYAYTAYEEEKPKGGRVW